MTKRDNPHAFYFGRKRLDGRLEEGYGPQVVQSTGRGTVFRVRKVAGRTEPRRDDKTTLCRQVARRGRRQAGAPFSRRAEQTKGPRNPPGGRYTEREAGRSNDAKPDGFRRRTNFSSEWMPGRRIRSAMEFHAIVCSGWLHRPPESWPT